MTPGAVVTPNLRRRMRRGMTLIEVMIAIVILTAAVLGLANFIRIFQHTSSDSSMNALAGDLATQRLESIKGDRVYAGLVTTYNGVVETYPATDPVYGGFTRTTAVVKCAGCPTATNDYVTVTVTVTGNNLTAPKKKTTVIAAF